MVLFMPVAIKDLGISNGDGFLQCAGHHHHHHHHPTTHRGHRMHSQQVGIKLGYYIMEMFW